MRALTHALLLAAILLPAAHAQNVISFDASAPIAPPPAANYHPGASTNPSGHTLAMNARYLTLDGKPWLPVMGEFHYSRTPADEWEEQLLKMKSAGVNIVSTYIFWIHHEEIEGQFDWSGQRNLRSFVEFCHKHGLYVIVRVGPWAHGEARNGGLPDWLLEKAPHIRRNDPDYLRYVDLFFAQIGTQLRGLTWKDGGPIIGVQIENEYGQRGPGAAEEHLRTLKSMALHYGLDTPLYTVTGWDRAMLPHGDFVSVFGGYPDAPWDASLHDLPPQEVYAFRFNTRVSSNMGAIGATGTPPPPATYDFPFLTAEMGGGIEDTYHRRPLLSPDDVAAMMPVMLGSGANLYGSYMFQGGINPDGKRTTLQESLATHYPNDLPEKSYDFQAPLGEFGNERPVLRKLKTFNYFLNDFGDLLAPMPAFAPTTLPSSPKDLSPTRVALRTDGHSGFLFFNNYVRGTTMPARPGFQISIKLKDEVLLIPEKPITLPSGTYGIWPFHLKLGDLQIAYATAQLFTRTTDPTGTTYYFVQTHGIPSDFIFEGQHPVQHRNVKPSLTPFITSGHTRLVLLSPEQAEQAWKLATPNGEHLLLTPADTFISPTEAVLTSTDPNFRYRLLPEAIPLTLSVKPATPTWTAVQTKKPGQAPPVPVVTQGTTRPRTIAAAPAAATLETAAATWTFRLPQAAWDGVHDLLYTIDYTGDVARLTLDGKLFDDNYFNGAPWRVSLHRLRESLAQHPLQLSILPLRADAPIFLEASFRPTSPSQSISLRNLRLTPEYRIHLNLDSLTKPQHAAHPH